MKPIVFAICLCAGIAAQNVSPVVEKNPSPPYLDNKEKLMIGEGAIGGLVPTSFMIILIAIIRILQLYKQRRQELLEREERQQLERARLQTLRRKVFIERVGIPTETLEADEVNASPTGEEQFADVNKQQSSKDFAD